MRYSVGVRYQETLKLLKLQAAFVYEPTKRTLPANKGHAQGDGNTDDHCGLLAEPASNKNRC
ncbi:MAG TPA: hypothetical protein VK582_00315 [Pyrinomonadaceae bacterium]|nr:hypothetical protein [Pyrinomonadaceae bacterium]